MISQTQLAVWTTRLGTHVNAGNLWHVAAVAVPGRLVGPIPPLHTVTTAVGKSPRVIVILPRQPLVIVERFWKKHLVTRAAEFGTAMHFRLEKCLLMERRLCFHQLPIGPRQEWRFTSSKWILRALFNNVISISTRGVHGNDGVTRRASDTGGTHRILGNVVMRIIKAGIFKGASEERHRIMAACAESRIVDISLALK